MAFDIVKKEIRELKCDAVIEILNTGDDRCEQPKIISPAASGGSCVVQIAIPRSTDSPEKGAVLIRECYHNLFHFLSVQKFDTVAISLEQALTRCISPITAQKILSSEMAEFSKSSDTKILFAAAEPNAVVIDPVLRFGLERYLEQAEEAQREQKRQEAMLQMASTGAFPAITSDKIEEYERREQKGFHSLPVYSSACFQDSGSSESGKEDPQPVGSFLPGRGAVLDESFSEMVLRKIDEKGYRKDSDFYIKANVDRKLFSRLRCNRNYHPKKTTALAYSVALELSLKETSELLSKAGYSLSHSILLDVIVEYCIVNRQYDIFEINELLCDYNQQLLGG